ncbi:hypothetical protein ACH5RR_040151 [Cinchona calisaya]|uniref:F-box/LRR-repeat protein 15-like leucin rich repeat domain-containing protein n=1 Tax=Cinchona calisaya TaxID=153742 RepID=A0ABD2XW95_9GENT
MGSMSDEEGWRDLPNSSRKKKFDGEENEGGDLKGKKIRMFENLEEKGGVFERIDGEKREGIGNEAMDSEEEINLDGKEVSCSDDLYPFGVERVDLDLNITLIESEDDEFVPVVVDRKSEIIDIPSDEGEDDEVKVIAAEDVKGKGKMIEEDNGYGRIEKFDFGLQIMGGNFGGNSFLSDRRTYTREEKGKAKVVDAWLSLGMNPIEFEFQQGNQDSIQFEFQQGNQDSIQFEFQQGNQDSIQLELQPGSQDLVEVNHPRENVHELEPAEPNLQLARRRYHIQVEMERHLELRRSARRFARWEDRGDASSSQEKPPLEDDTLLGKSPGPFSSALKMVRDRKSKQAEQLIVWKPSNNGCNASRPCVPSLVDLSMEALAANAEAIVSLELVPDILRQRLTNLICNLRKMNIHTFELLVRGSPTEIYINDCSWLTDEQFLKTFRSLDTKDLMVLQLELCGQCTLDYVMKETLARCSKSLPNLGVISLKGACRLSDNGLKALVASAPALQSINLSQCSLVTNVGIDTLASSLGSMLRELYISDCHKIDAMLILPALKKFEYLEVLSVAGIHNISDQFVDGLIKACGQNLKELDFANCLDLTNCSLRVIGDTCTGLHSLNISNLDKLTDLGLQYLANGCRHIQKLKLCRNQFSDEAVAAFLEASGESLKELSLNNVTLVGPCTAFSLAKSSRKLLGLDLSWCRKITNEALGLIVDSCSSLKLVKLFGCTQITNAFLNSHSNPQVKIIGLQLTPILESINVIEPSEVLLRYSPMRFLSDTTDIKTVLFSS